MPLSLNVERGGRGRDLVLLHGWGLNSRVWSAALPRLESAHRVHRVDLPGHGGSARVAFRGLEQAADRVAASIPDDACVCGWSMGGMVAVALALRHPEKARALVLVAATPCFAERPDWPHGMAARTLDEFAAEVRADPTQALDRFSRLNAVNGAGAREAARALAQCAREAPADRDALEQGLRVLRETDLRPDAARIDRPTLVVHGTRDAVAGVGAGRWLAATIPGARLVEVEDAAHVPFLTHREAFACAVEALDG